MYFKFFQHFRGFSQTLTCLWTTTRKQDTLRCFKTKVKVTFIFIYVHYYASVWNFHSILNSSFALVNQLLWTVVFRASSWSVVSQNTCRICDFDDWLYLRKPGISAKSYVLSSRGREGRWYSSLSVSYKINTVVPKLFRFADHLDKFDGPRGRLWESLD